MKPMMVAVPTWERFGHSGNTRWHPRYPERQTTVSANMAGLHLAKTPLKTAAVECLNKIQLKAKIRMKMNTRMGMILRERDDVIDRGGLLTHAQYHKTQEPDTRRIR